MKKCPVQRTSDRACIIVIAVILLAVLCSSGLRGLYMSSTAQHPFIAGFLKFAILSTFGESLAQRLLKGTYLPENFYFLPRFIMWGALGVLVTIAFTIFAAGAPALLVALGFDWGAAALAGPLGWHKICAAFTISVTMNCIFSPVLMVAHKLGDMRMAACCGNLFCLCARPDIAGMLKNIDWTIMWKLVLFRSVLYFWIPAHTITFLLPPAFRVLFAAFLGAALGLILAWAGHREKKTQPEVLV